MAELGPGRDARTWLRRARLVSGLVLMAFALTHFLNHALGLHSMDLMERVRAAVVVWHTAWGWPVVALAVLVHTAAALATLYRRRSLRMPAWQWLQVVSGLAIPFLMVQHYIGSRVLPLATGLSGGYPLELYVIWGLHPVRHSLGLLVVWLHGCVGIHYWLRLEAWYRPLQPALLAAAVLVPALALTGFVAAGREMAVLAADPDRLAAYARANNWPFAPEHFAFVYDSEARALAALAAILVLVLLARVVRRHLRERRNSYRVDYGQGRIVRAPRGTTLLEASRMAGMPHAAVCGGRGRCSTCRVRITEGLETQPPATSAEARVLERLAAPADVRLACQLRPAGDLAVIRLLPAATTARRALAPMDPGHGIEREIAVLFADLRGFTELSEGRLPFDVVHLLNRYFQAMGQAIEAEGGHVDKFVGDGIVALFGIDGDTAAAARAALRGVRGMDRALARLNEEFAGELDRPLAMVAGLHSGPAIIGEMGYGAATGLTAIGDTVNVASRLEGVAKEHDVALAVTVDLLERAGLPLPEAGISEITLRGRSAPLRVAMVPDVASLPLPAAKGAIHRSFGDRRPRRLRAGPDGRRADA